MQAPKASRFHRNICQTLLIGTAAIPSAAWADSVITPYVELRQISQWTEPGGATSFYLEPSAGLSAAFETKRVDGNLDYRVGAPAGLSGDFNRGTRHFGSAAVAAEVIRDYFDIGATGTASLLNTGFSGLFNPDYDDPSRQQVFAGAVQPSFQHVFLSRLAVSAQYTYSAVEANNGSLPPLVIGAPFSLEDSSLAAASDSRSQIASASISNVGRSSRFRTRLTGSWQKDRIEQLDTHFDSARAVADVELVINRKFSLLGSGGYEDILSEADNLLVDRTTGLPILDARGLLQVDPTNPRLTDFDYEGETYDAGLRYSPSRRLTFVARAGKRSGSFAANGSLQYRVNPVTRFTAGYNEGIDNFGRLLTSIYVDPVTGAVTPIRTYAGGDRTTPVGASRCAAGFDFDTGFCRFNITQLASSATFKTRTASINLEKGDPDYESELPSFWSASLFYSRRQYLGTRDSGFGGAGGAAIPALTLAGTTDSSFGLTGHYERLTSGTSFVVVDVQAQYNQFKLSQTLRDAYASVRVQYDMLVDRQINLFAAAFVDRRFIIDGAPNIPNVPFFDIDSTRATFSIGARYLFRRHTGKFTPKEFAPSQAY